MRYCKDLHLFTASISGYAAAYPSFVSENQTDSRFRFFGISSAKDLNSARLKFPSNLRTVKRSCFTSDWIGSTALTRSLTPATSSPSSARQSWRASGTSARPFFSSSHWTSLQRKLSRKEETPFLGYNSGGSTPMSKMPVYYRFALKIDLLWNLRSPKRILRVVGI